MKPKTNKTQLTQGEAMNPNHRRSGLILLVVLSMLALFGMLSITFVVFSSQSRNASSGMARRDYRGMQPGQVLDEAMRQALRGSSNSRSAIGPHSLLADLYGHNESLPANLADANNNLNLDFLGRVVTANAPSARAEIFANRFLRIPLDTTVSTVPALSDILTGRVLTFLQGPLRGISFRIVRSIGDLTGSSDTDVSQQSHSVVIDLDEARNASVTVGTTTHSMSEWINLAVATPNLAADLCAGFQLRINARELNGLGYGIPTNFDGGTNTATLDPSTRRTALQQPVGLLPGWQARIGADTTLHAGFTGDSDESYDAPDYNDFWLAHRRGTASEDIIPSFHRAALVNYIVNSEDLTNTTSFTQDDFLDMLDDIQRACARPLAINVVNLENVTPNSYVSESRFFDGSNPGQFGATPPRIPTLSIDIGGTWTNWTIGSPSPYDEFDAWVRQLTSGPWDVDNDGDGVRDSVWVDPDLPLITSPEGKLLKMMAAYYIEDMDSRLDINAVGNLSQNSTVFPASTGSNSSFTLSTTETPQGLGVGPAEIGMRHLFASDAAHETFLRTRYGGRHPGWSLDASFNAVDDLRSRLQAGGSPNGFNLGTGGVRNLFSHAQQPGFPLDRRGTWGLGIDRLGNPLQVRGNMPSVWVGGTNYVAGDVVFHGSIYVCIMNHSASVEPGVDTNWTTNWVIPLTVQTSPPTAWASMTAYTAGQKVRNGGVIFSCLANHTAAAADEPGNGANWPNYWFRVHMDESTNDPYEAMLVRTPYEDTPFSLAEWERIYRARDWDRSMLPDRLEGFTAMVNNIDAIAPRTAHTRHTPMTFTATAAADSSKSFLDFITMLGSYRDTPIVIDAVSYSELFPLEFNRGMAMNINRPFGNGIDDDADGLIDEPEEMLKNNIDDDGMNGVDDFGEFDLVTGATTLDYTQRQRSVYVSGTTVASGAVNEFPVFDATNGQDNGYFSGNLDPDYEAIVAPATEAIAIRHHGQQSRQLLARHLYSLAMLIMPDSLHVASRPSPLTGNDRARLLAQWAVNVVDFRDADTAMTRFPYDPEPFDAENGVYWIPNRSAPPAQDPVGEVVWGMEQPELLLTETGAFHDLRVRDTSNEAPNPTMGAQTDDSSMPDDDYDQYRLPEGSLFLEFLCPRTTGVVSGQMIPSPGKPYKPDAVNSAEGVLNLSALSPSNGTTTFPVWRVAISEPHPGSTDSPNGIINGAASSAPHEVSYQLMGNLELAGNMDSMSMPISDATTSGLTYDYSASITAPAIDRILWFTDPANVTNVAAAAVGLPSTIAAADIPAHVYGNNVASNVEVGGGQYLVVGPRQVTYFGSKTSAGVSQVNEPNNHRIVLENGTVSSGTTPAAYASWASIYTASNELVGRRTAMRDVVPMIAVTDPPSTWTGTNVPTEIGLNVSAPHPTASGFYAEPTEQLNSTNATADTTNNAAGFSSLAKDSYYDFGTSTGVGLPDAPFDSVAGTPIATYYEPSHPEATTTAGVAAPGTELNWCTAFLQRLADPERPWHPTFNPYITVDWMPIDLTVFSGEDSLFMDAMKSMPFSTTYQFGFRQKNGTIGSDRERTFLSYANDDPRDSTGSATGVHFDDELPIDNVTGAITAKTQVPRPTTQANSFSTLGYLNSAYTMLNDPTVSVPVFKGVRGAPANVPANLFWLNRNFASPYEMLWVPFSAPGQLMQEFGAPTGTPGDHYANDSALNEFTHLLNFFQQAASTGGSGLDQSFSPFSIMELIQTPSPWSDEAKIVRPADYTLTDTRERTALGPLMPPYNQVHGMIERGRVNINTVELPEVWQGVEWNYQNSTERTTFGSGLWWSALTASRDGFDSSVADPGFFASGNANLHGEYPTQFPGIFKSSFSVGRVPGTRQGVLDIPDSASPTPNPIMSTLLRQGTSNRPLFEPRSTFASQNNPMFEYLPLTRLPNLVTQRSNVFAVRVTVGYFEYSPTTGIGAEYGWDTGESRRHRAFYVIDRSIPVAFEPGEDHNTDRCILLRRIIE